MKRPFRRAFISALASAALLASLLPAVASAAGPATQLVFTAQPTTTAHGATIPTVTVSVEDASSAVVTTSTVTVGLSILGNPGAGTLSGTVSAAAVNGVATFSDLSINNAGVGYTLVATSTGLTGATSGAFTIVGAATKLAFTTQPSSTSVNTSIAPAVTVSVEDVNNQVVTTSSAPVTVAIGTNPSAGTLAGTLTVSASSGVATFSNLSINNSGVGYTLTAASGGLTGATSTAFTISGVPTHLVFGTQPSNTAANAPISPVVTVMVEDASNQVVTTSAAGITLAIGTNPGGGALSGTTTVNAVNGIATFSSLAINSQGNGYTLTAASSGLTGATSSTFNITLAQTLAFAVQPGGGAAGAIWIQQPVVDVLNSLSQVVTTDNTTVVTLAIATNPAGGTLSCTGGMSELVVNGVATFTGCSINFGSASAYTLTATSNPSWTPVTSTAFYIGGTANPLVFVTQPGGGAAGAIWTQQPVVAVENASNAVVSDYSTVVYLSISTNPAGGTLSCTGGTSEVAVNGYAYFTGCSIDLGSASTYTLTATSSPSWTPAVSAAFYIGGTANHLVFVTQPGGGAAGAVWSVQPVVAVENASNAVVSDNSVVYLSISTNPAGGTLSCTGGTSEVAVNGYAYFTGCSINLGSASAYTLTATSSLSWTPATSSAFYVGGSSQQLVFVTQPDGGAAGAIWSVQPVVAVENASNAVVSDYSTVVYLSIATNPAGGTLSCTGGTSEVAVNGYAYFSGCSIDLGSASAYTLTATSSPAWTAATSNGFYVGSSQASVTIASDTAIGQATSGFSRATKIVRPGTWITVRFQTSPALAGRTLGVWIAKKTGGVWGAFSPHASITTNSLGVAYYQYRTSSKVWQSFLVRFAGDTTAAPSSSSGTQVRWL